MLFLPVTPRLQAQDPGAQQDAESAREKLLKAEDELDNIQANSEATKTSVDGMKNDVATLQSTVTALQADNAALKQQVANLESTLDEYKTEQIKERQTLIDNVAAMIAAGKGTKSGKKKSSAMSSEASPGILTPAESSDTPAAPSLAPPPDTSQRSAEDTAPAPPKPQKGYYHVVANGETLTMICTAYRENGVHVTVSQIRKANGLAADSVLKPGQKIFIPKPGT